MNNYEEVLFEKDEISINILVSREEETVWLSLNDICLLFNRTKSSMSRQLKIILRNEFGDENSVVSKTASVVRKIETTALDGKNYLVDYYSCDLVILVGKRIVSPIIGVFQNWCLNLFKDEVDKSVENDEEIIIYNNNGINVSIKVSPKEDTVWMNQNQIAMLFETTQPNVSTHIKNIIEEGELETISVHKDFLYTAPDGKKYLNEHRINEDFVINY